MPNLRSVQITMPGAFTKTYLHTVLKADPVKLAENWYILVLDDFPIGSVMNSYGTDTVKLLHGCSKKRKYVAAEESFGTVSKNADDSLQWCDFCEEVVPTDVIMAIKIYGSFT